MSNNNMKQVREYDDEPFVLCVIITYNSESYIDSCIQSIEKQLYHNKKILLIDNNSTDNVLKVVPDHIEFIKNNHNKGFAYAVNQGLLHGSYMGAKYIMILNPDTVMEDNSLANLVKAAESDDQIGVVGPNIVDEVGVDAKCDNEQITNINVSWICGCGMLFRSKVVIDTGLFDTRYFLYYEETDYLLRMSRNNWKIIKCNNATMIHIGAASTKSMKTKAYFYLVRNIFVYSKKNMIREGLCKCIVLMCKDALSKLYFPMHPLRLLAYIMGILCGVIIFLAPVRIDGELI